MKYDEVENTLPEFNTAELGLAPPVNPTCCLLLFLVTLLHMLQSVGHPKCARSIDLRLDQGAHCSTWTRIYSDINRPLKSLYCQTDQLKESVWEEQLVWVCLMALRRVAQFWVVWCCLTCSCSSHVKCGDAAVGCSAAYALLTTSILANGRA